MINTQGKGIATGEVNLNNKDLKQFKLFSRKFGKFMEYSLNDLENALYKYEYDKVYRKQRNETHKKYVAMGKEYEKLNGK